MLEIDRLLSTFTRRLPSLRGVWRVKQFLRRIYILHYRDRTDSWIAISDFDKNLRLKLNRGTYLGATIYWYGYQSFGELRLLNQLLKPDMVFADIGANFGEFTLYAAKRLPSGKVLAFEPLDAMYKLLVENVSLNNFKNVLVYNLGLSENAGHYKLFTSEDTVIHHGFNEGLSSLFPSEYRSKPVGEVEIDTFDRVFEKTRGNRLDIMKIDVEGAELPVLRGAQKVLTTYRPTIIVEINEGAFNAAGYSTRDVTAFLESFKYKISLINADGTSVPMEYLDLPPLCNVLCQCP